jgi:hypothetical protein
MIGRKKCVCYAGRFAGIWPVTSVEGERGDGACTTSEGVEFQNDHFKGPQLMRVVKIV